MRLLAEIALKIKSNFQKKNDEIEVHLLKEKDQPKFHSLINDLQSFKCKKII
jgi:hypothetical protein